MALNMQVKILPFGYVGRIVERGDRFTVRLASGALVICTAEMLKEV